MRICSIALALLLGATASSAQQSPAAIFLTWDGNPTNTVSVDWHLDAGTDIETVEIRGPGISGWSARTGAKFQFPHSTRMVRRARITDLKPGATYELRVGASRVYTYRTMPARLTRPVRFATGGDTRADDASFGSVNRYVAKQDVDFVLLGGDLAYSNGDPRQVRQEELWFETAFKTLVTPQGRLIPVIAAIGNHEVFSNRDTAQAVRDMIEKTGVKQGDATYYRPLHAHARERQYSIIDVGDYLSLVLLNTGHTAAIPGAQTEWLRDALAARPTVTHIFPVYHVPGYPSVRAFSASNSTQVRENWSPLFERAGVRVAFENHDHAYKRTYPIRAGHKDSTGIVYLGDGAWGAGPREIGRDNKAVPEWYLEKTASVNHGIIVTLDDASARFEVRDTIGTLVDRLRVLKRQTTAGAPRGTQQDTTPRRLPANGPMF